MSSKILFKQLKERRVMKRLLYTFVAFVAFFMFSAVTLHPQEVTKWGFLGGRIGGWQFSQSGDSASVGGSAQATSPWVALRGEFDTSITATTDEAIVVTGKIEFVGSGIDT